MVKIFLKNSDMTFFGFLAYRPCQKMYGKMKFSIHLKMSACTSTRRFFVNNSRTLWPIFIKLFFAWPMRHTASSPRGFFWNFENFFSVIFWHDRVFKCMEKLKFQYKFLRGRFVKILKSWKIGWTWCNWVIMLAPEVITFDWIDRFGWFFYQVVGYGILQRLELDNRGEVRGWAFIFCMAQNLSFWYLMNGRSELVRTFCKRLWGGSGVEIYGGIGERCAVGTKCFSLITRLLWVRSGWNWIYNMWEGCRA